MKHPTSSLLHAYWDGLRGARAAPERAEIEPGEIRHILADSLILEVDPALDVASVRLAGTRLCALFGAELRGRRFQSLWGSNPASDPWRLIEVVVQETVGIVAGLVGTTAEGDAVDLELLLLPLRHRGKTQARVIGSLSASGAPLWLGLRPLTAMRTVSLRVLTGTDRHAPAADLPPEPANDHEQARRPRLVVHRGGRT